MESKNWKYVTETCSNALLKLTHIDTKALMTSEINTFMDFEMDHSRVTGFRLTCQL